MGAALCNPRPAPASAVPSLRRNGLTDRADSPSLAHSALSAASLPLRPGRHAPFGAPDGAQHLAFKSLFLFSVWGCLGGRKRVCEDNGWLKKTEDRRFLMNTARAGWYLKVFSATRWRLRAKNAKERFLLNARSLNAP